MFRHFFRGALWVALPMLFLLTAFANTPKHPPANDASQEIALAQETSRAAGSLPIPDDQTEVDLDGVCDEGEYANAETLSFQDAEGMGTIYLKHDFDNLYVCIEAQLGTTDERYTAVYLDPQGDGSSYEFAQDNDYSLQINIPNNTRSSMVGTGDGGYTDVSGNVNGLWEGMANTSQENESAEYRISLGRFFIDNCQIFGLAFGHHSVMDADDDYGWPDGMVYNQPRTWQPSEIDSGVCEDRDGRIAYVYRGNTADANSFYNLLSTNGYAVDLIPLGDVLSTNFANYDLVIIANDSGSLSNWGSVANQVSQITDPNIPILGLGEGGYAFFGELSLFIGWPNGWHGPEDDVLRATTAPTAYYTGIGPDPVQVYTEPVNEVGIYLDDDETLPPDVIPVGLEPPDPDHASLILEGCYHLWGFSGNPLEMTGDGETLFLNAVAYAIGFQCPVIPEPQEPCLSIEKTANPPDGSTVEPGDVIEYTITYVLNDDPDCENPDRARLIDMIPADTMYVPGSASGGINPTADGALVWGVSAASGEQTETFRVRVSDTQCHNGEVVRNQARLVTGGGATLTSNVVEHEVDCPDIHFPNDEPTYAEEEIQIMPYPMVTGQPSTISVKVNNNSSNSKNLTVSFQTSPNRFGIGLGYNAFDTKNVTLPAFGSAIVQTTFTPVSSGHYCIQIVIESDDGERIVSQRNLDVTEDLEAGTPDELVFDVGNPTDTTADVMLVVNNTCPGWTAEVSPTVLTNMAPGEVREATLTVTPPDPVTLGSACHIDVQGWIGDELIGGIRKLDVPPVQLPQAEPHWMEPEISVIPDPPVAGVSGLICVELQNPLNFSRNVTIDYAVADFGAGINFTTVASQNFTLPPNSVDDYCVTWTPATGGTTHRCILVTLMQPGYKDQTSQRNVNIVRLSIGDILDDIRIPVLVRNPDWVNHNLEIRPTVFGIDPYWEPVITDDDGNPPPEVLGPGEMVNLNVGFQPAGGPVLSQAPEQFDYGDESRVEVAVLLDGEEVGGFTAVVMPPPVPVEEVSISGPEEGMPDEAYTFTAEVMPSDATQPITYTWYADEQDMMEHTGGLTDTITFTWDMGGLKTIYVTATNETGVVTDIYDIMIEAEQPSIIGMDEVSISGPNEGVTGEEYTFTAEVMPSDATQPITYTWYPDDLNMMEHTGGLTDTATFMWDSAGLKTIEVMAMNEAGMVSATHTITIELMLSGVQEVSISGVDEGVTGEEYTFTAEVMPLYAATPVTYTWEADDQDMGQHTSGLTDTATFMWETSGLKTVEVMAMNSITGTAMVTHEIMIELLPIAVEGVSISGPEEGQPGEDYTFTAEVSPANATQPITYTWEADGQDPVVHSGGGASDTVTFSWENEDTMTVQVTAMNAEGSAMATHDITIEAAPPVVAVEGVSISGPEEGITGETYTFTAEVSPSDATEPVTYEWGAIGQDPVTHEDGGLTDTVTFSWDTEGEKDITVEATNGGGSANATYLITIGSGPTGGAGEVYLPLILRP